MIVLLAAGRAATFKAAPEAFDFVITNREIPGMSGIKLGNGLRKFLTTIKVPLSTSRGFLTEAEAMQRGFCGLLNKPFSFGLFCRALSSTGLPKALVKNYLRYYQS